MPIDLAPAQGVSLAFQGRPTATTARSMTTSHTPSRFPMMSSFKFQALVAHDGSFYSRGEVLASLGIPDIGDDRVKDDEDMSIPPGEDEVKV